MMATLFLLLALMSAVSAAVLVLTQRRVLGERAPRVSRRSLPPVSILKPLKGADPGLADNLASFFRLDYPELEIVFSFASAADPALEVARGVADAHPNVPVSFVIGGGEPGGNPKVCRLMAALTRARHRHVLISDGDVRVSPRFLAETAVYFADRRVGLVSNLFAGRGGQDFGSRIENLHLNGFTMGGTAAVSRLLGRPCVVGKSMLLSREALDWIGGLASVMDFLAEDYLLGDAIARAGFRVVLAPHLVSAISLRKPVRAFWDRHVRWARMRRKLAGAAYLFEALASPLPWALLALACPGSAWLDLAAVGLVVSKISMEVANLRRLGILSRFEDIVLIPVKDLLAFGVFWAALLSDRTVWRGKKVRLGRCTLLEAA